MTSSAGVIPAALSFLAIYSPPLSTSDETFGEQILYYHSKQDDDGQSKARESNDVRDAGESKEHRNEKLRQVGLAQGMVAFAKNFSDGKAVDSIETERSRIILHELETDWWLLASVNLTRLPSSSGSYVQDQAQKSNVTVEYSAREVSPPALLLQQVIRAHEIFLLHHASSMVELFARLQRTKFCEVLKRFWDRFIWNWNVLLHGNPAVDVFNGLKLAAGGELGVGVGEEDWGSGEREVLEGFVGRTEGLVDLIVSRFGESPSTSQSSSPLSSARPSPKDKESNLEASERYPRPSDGVIFSGVGALTRASVKAISSWTEWLYMHEQDAYGVQDNPSSAPRRKRRKIVTSDSVRAGPEESLESDRNISTSENKDSRSRSSDSPHGSPNIPPPILMPNKSHFSAKQKSKFDEANISTKDAQDNNKSGVDEPGYATETLMKYLTLGVYGSKWGIPAARPPAHRRVSSLREGGTDSANQKLQRTVSDNVQSIQRRRFPSGYFLIGLQGELDEEIILDDSGRHIEASSLNSDKVLEEKLSGNRIRIRTLHIQRLRQNTPGTARDTDVGDNAAREVLHNKVRVIVYVQQPFMFTFLFEMQTDSLAIPSFYRSLHHQLGPLQHPLLTSTSLSKVTDRLGEAIAPKSTAAVGSTQAISDLVYDPDRLTVHTTIPNIPDPRPAADHSMADSIPWSRVEALSVHSQILNTYASTRRLTSELERTCKTGRGWWVVWMRLPPQVSHQISGPQTFREAFLIRKASDYIPPAARQTVGRDGRNASGSQTSGGWGAGKLAEGIGIDARQYIDGLLSLNR